MRFTKIPLIATLMAVALSLLIVLPVLAQARDYDDTRGTLSSGSGLKVDVLKGDTDTDMADSYFNGNLYVSNDDEANFRVMITAASIATNALPGADGVEGVRADTGTGTTQTIAANDDFDCGAKATVKNNRSGRSYTVYLDNDANDDGVITDQVPAGTQSAVFQVVGAGTESETGVCDSITLGGTDAQGATVAPADVPAVIGLVPARHGDTLTITVAGVSGSVTLEVDAEGPDFSEVFPNDGDFLSSPTVKFRFAVTDSDSGLAHDGELDYSRGDTDARAINGDNDNFLSGEPRSMDGGATRDIKVLLGATQPLNNVSDDQSEAGNSSWSQRGDRPGVSYFLDMSVTGQDEIRYYWQLSATDRAGNTTETDSDSDESGAQPYQLFVDSTSPEFKDARTGISFDEDKRTEIVDRSSIAVTFNDRNKNFDAVTGVDIDKFLVEGNTVVGFVQPGAKSDCKETTDEDDRYPKDIDGNCLGSQDVPTARVYLQLAEPLAPDARPQVSMFGGAVLDLAGNPSSQDEIVPVDLIAPGLTVTLVTDVTGRPVIKRGGEITVTISSDEELRRLPTVYFAPVLDDSSTEDKVKAILGNPRPGDRVTVVSGETESWSRTYDDNDIGNSDGLYALVVVGEDDNNNVGGTPGWNMARTDKAPTNAHKADIKALEAAGLLVEIDKNIADPVFSISPETDVDTDETESSNPFITIDFAAERGEYQKDDEGNTIKNFPADSHSAVEIVSITLNGSDVSGNVSAVSNRKYTLGARDLATGSYELKVTGRDDVGNEVSDTYDFDVVARKAYKVNLTPGWNLVSVPGTPLDSSVQAVMSDSMQASIVLAYQDDAWLTAVNDNGTWRGTLTDIVGGYGYWVQTTAFEAISALIPETDTSSVLPTASVIAGWNLLGVVDVQQNSFGKAPSGGDEADDYFKNLEWKVAYSFDTSNNTWSKSIPDDGDNDNEIVNGKGYWVWSTEAGTLVP